MTSDGRELLQDHHQPLYFQKKLRFFNVCGKKLEIFHHCVMASALFSSVVCWGGSILTSNTNRVKKLIKKAGNVIGCS